MKIKEIKITVTPDHLDEMNHVNNVVYLQWVQDVAEAHWKTNATEEMLQSFVWVALRHEIDYKSPGFLSDELTLKTWVERFEGVKSLRKVQIIREKDNKVLAEALSTWCMLDAETGRPLRIGEELMDRYRNQ